MRALLLSLLLLPVVAGAQAAYAPALDWRPPGANWTSSAGSASAVLVAPLTSNGPLLAEDAGTVAHVYWNGSGLVDTKGNAWTQGGTVPQVAAGASPFVPGKAGAGPYSAANHYYGPASLMEWGPAGDFSVSVVVVPRSTTIQILVAKQANANTGWEVYTNGSTAACWLYDGSVKGATASGVVLGGVNVITCGRSGSAIYARANAGAVGSVAVGNMVSAAAYPVRFGRAEGAGYEAGSATIYEVIASTTPYSDALHAARFAAVWGQSALTVTRALDTQTYAANGLTWSAPAATLATESTGAAVWKASTNSILQSSSSCTGTAVQTPWALNGTPTCTANVIAGPDGTLTMDEWVGGTSTSAPFQTVTIASSSVYTGSAWIQKTASGAAGLLLSATGATACSCVTSTGAACTASIYATNYCKAVVTVGTTPIRVMLTATAGSDTTAVNLYQVPGDYAVAAGTARFWGAQVEPGSYATPYIPTTTATVTRNVTLPSTALPSTGNRFCVSVTATPSGLPAASWNRSASGMHPVGGGSYAAANSWTLFTGWNSTTWGLTIWDGAAATKSWTGPGLSAGPHRLTFCGNNGVGQLCVDGAPVASTPSGAGTGLLTTPPGTLYLGV